MVYHCGGVENSQVIPSWKLNLCYMLVQVCKSLQGTRCTLTSDYKSSVNKELDKSDTTLNGKVVFMC